MCWRWHILLLLVIHPMLVRQKKQKQEVLLRRVRLHIKERLVLEIKICLGLGVLL